MDSTDPDEPMDSTDPDEPMDSTDPDEARDARLPTDRMLRKDRTDPADIADRTEPLLRHDTQPSLTEARAGRQMSRAQKATQLIGAGRFTEPALPVREEAHRNRIVPSTVALPSTENVSVTLPVFVLPGTVISSPNVPGSTQPPVPTMPLGPRVTVILP